jgi:hypothetical protein
LKNAEQGKAVDEKWDSDYSDLKARIEKLKSKVNG